VATWQGHENSIFTVQWHPDGTQLITGSGDRTARLWDVETQRTLNAFEGHTGTIKSISFYRPNPGKLQHKTIIYWKSHMSF
jgi:WD40 repeat protein